MRETHAPTSLPLFRSPTAGHPCIDISWLPLYREGFFVHAIKHYWLTLLATFRRKSEFLVQELLLAT
jgi:hypothetical protein